MPKFAANISTMYKEFQIPDRFAAAAAHGFSAVEFLNPYPFAIDDIRSWLQQANLDLILINTRPGLQGEKAFGLAALPGREQDFRQVFSEAHDYATALGANMIHVLAGVVRDLDEAEVKNTFQQNINWAAETAAKSGINIMLEPLNQTDVPGYLYTSSAAVADLIDDLALPNIFLQYDFYHMQIMEGNLAANMEKHLDKIGHVQFSSLPGRHEPQFGEVDVHRLFEFLDAVGYAGWVGCEYTAKTTTAEGLTWARPYGIGTSA